MILLTFMFAFVAVGGLACLAELSATVHGTLNWLTKSMLQSWAADSPEINSFLLRANPVCRLLIQAAMIVPPVFVVCGLCLLLSADRRRVWRMAHNQFNEKREKERIDELVARLEAKELARKKRQLKQRRWHKPTP